MIKTHPKKIKIIHWTDINPILFDNKYQHCDFHSRPRLWELYSWSVLG